MSMTTLLSKSFLVYSLLWQMPQTVGLSFPRTHVALTGNASWSRLKFVLNGSDSGRSPIPANMRAKATFGGVPAEG